MKNLIVICTIILFSSTTFASNWPTCKEANKKVLRASRLYNTSMTRVLILCTDDFYSTDCNDANYMMSQDYQRLWLTSNQTSAACKASTPPPEE